MSSRHRTATTVLAATLLVGAIGTVWLLVTGSQFAVALVLVGIPLGIGGAVALYVRRASRRQGRIESGFRDRRAMVLGERYLDVTTACSALEAAHEEWTQPETQLDIVADELDAVGITVDTDQGVVSIEELEDPSLDRIERCHDDIDEAIATVTDSFGAYAASTRDQLKEIADNVGVSLETQTTDPKTIDDCRALSAALTSDREALEAALTTADASDTPTDSTRSALETAFASTDTEPATDTDSKTVDDEADDDSAAVALGPPEPDTRSPEAAVDEDEAAEGDTEQTADAADDLDDEADESEVVDEDDDDPTDEPVDKDGEPAEPGGEVNEEDEPAEPDEPQQEPVVAFPVTDTPSVTHPALAEGIESKAEQTDTDDAKLPADSDPETEPAEPPDSQAESTDTPTDGSAPLETLTVARPSAGPGTSEAIDPDTVLLDPAAGDEQPVAEQTKQPSEKAPDKANTDSGEQTASEQADSSESATVGANDETDTTPDEPPKSETESDTAVDAATQNEEPTAGDPATAESSSFADITDDVSEATDEAEPPASTPGILYTPDEVDSQEKVTDDDPGSSGNPLITDDDGTDDKDGYVLLGADDTETGGDETGGDETGGDELDLDMDSDVEADDSILLGGEQPTEQEASTTPTEEEGDDTEDTVLSLGDSEAEDGTATSTPGDDDTENKQTGEGEDAGENEDENDEEDEAEEADKNVETDEAEENQGKETRDDTESVDDDSSDTT